MGLCGRGSEDIQESWLTDNLEQLKSEWNLGYEPPKSSMILLKFTTFLIKWDQMKCMKAFNHLTMASNLLSSRVFSLPCTSPGRSSMTSAAPKSSCSSWLPSPSTVTESLSSKAPCCARQELVKTHYINNSTNTPHMLTKTARPDHHFSGPHWTTSTSRRNLKCPPLKSEIREHLSTPHESQNSLKCLCPH